MSSFEQLSIFVRYLHPCDPGWDSAKNDYAQKKPHNATKTRRTNTQEANRSSAIRLTRYSSPRIPQSDLFRLNVDENRPRFADHFQSDKGGRNRGARLGGRGSSEARFKVAQRNKARSVSNSQILLTAIVLTAILQSSVSSTVTDRHRYSLNKISRESLDVGLGIYGDQIAKLFKELAKYIHSPTVDAACSLTLLVVPQPIK